MLEFKLGARSIEFRDDDSGRNIARITVHEQKVYIETEGNHGGSVVYTAVRIDSVRFLEALVRGFS
jgi:hypothetical protein